MVTETAQRPAGAAVARRSARERLLDAAGDLFYAEGVHTVGIDRIIEHAGVAKASLYNTFGSKDELVRAYLHQRHASIRVRITAALARYDEPRARLLGMFDAQAERMAEPGYRGCAFVNASAETQHGSAVERVSAEHRAWIRATFADLARACGVGDPDVLARQLVLLYDGAQVSARMDHDPAVPAATRAAAESLLEAALARA